MAGLLDFMNDPVRMGLLSSGVATMDAARQGNPNAAMIGPQYMQQLAMQQQQAVRQRQQDAMAQEQFGWERNAMQAGQQRLRGLQARYADPKYQGTIFAEIAKADPEAAFKLESTVNEKTLTRDKKYEKVGNDLVEIPPDGSKPTPVYTAPPEPISAYQAEELKNSSARLAEEQRHNRTVEGPQIFGPGSGGQPSGLSGDALLQSLPPQTAAQVKALAEGRMQFPGGFALKSPYWQNMLSAVSQYDPSFDAINYNARAKTQADANTGTMGKSNNAINTVIQHLGALSDSIEPLDTTSGYPGATLVNSAINSVEKSSGKTNITSFDAVKGHVAEELVRAWRGTGGNESDIQRSLADLNASNTKEQLHASVHQIAKLLEGKIAANQQQYESAMGAAVPKRQFITPEARSVLDTIEGRAGGNAGAATATKVLNGKTYVKINGQWHDSGN